MKSIFVLLQLFSVLERFSYDLEKWFCKCSLFVLSANGWKVKNIASSFSRQRNPNMEKAVFDWPMNPAAVWRQRQVSVYF